MFTTDLVNLYNRNIFKTSLYIYIFQDEKCRISLSLAYTEIHHWGVGGAPVLMIRVCNVITVKMIKHFLLFRTFLVFPTVVHTGGGRGMANSPTPWDF